MNMDTHFTPDPPRSPAGLDRAELDELIFRAIAEWIAGEGMPSLEAVRLRGTEAQYEICVNRICAFDDAQRDREVERQVTRLRAERAD
jgi:hypothetical protein